MQTKYEELKNRFREVYDRQFQRVYRLSLFLMGNREDAEDALQIVFTRFWEKQPRFRETEHENAWFITVTRNLCRDLQKEYYRKKRTSLSEAPEAAVEFSYEEDSGLWQAMQELPQKYRAVLYLYYYEGYSVREMSHIFHKKESTLQTQLADGRRKLRDILETE